MRLLRIIGLFGLLVPVVQSFGTRSLCAGEQSNGHQFAVLVGVSTYDHNEIPPLHFAAADANSLGNLLQENGWKALITTDATKSSLNETVGKHLSQVTPKDDVLVFFAGHGVQSADGDLIFCPKDFDPTNRELTGFSLTQLYRQLDRLHAKRSLVIVDACSAGSIKFQLPSAPNGISTFVSSKVGEFAYESDKLQHGIFTHYLMKSIAGAADVNRDKEITMAEIVAWTSREVMAHSKNAGVIQTPEFTDNGHLGEFVIAKQAKPIIELPPGNVGPTVRVKKADGPKLSIKNELGRSEIPNSTVSSEVRNSNVFVVTNLHTHGFLSPPSGCEDDINALVRFREARDHYCNLARKPLPLAVAQHPALTDSAGMLGALIIEHELYEIPELKHTFDRIFQLQPTQTFFTQNANSSRTLGSLAFADVYEWDPLALIRCNGAGGRNIITAAPAMPVRTPVRDGTLAAVLNCDILDHEDQGIWPGILIRASNASIPPQCFPSVKDELVRFKLPDVRCGSVPAVSGHGLSVVETGDATPVFKLPVPPETCWSLDDNAGRKMMLPVKQLPSDLTRAPSFRVEVPDQSNWTAWEVDYSETSPLTLMCFDALVDVDSALPKTTNARFHFVDLICPLGDQHNKLVGGINRVQPSSHYPLITAIHHLILAPVVATAIDVADGYQIGSLLKKLSLAFLQCHQTPESDRQSTDDEDETGHQTQDFPSIAVTNNPDSPVVVLQSNTKAEKVFDHALTAHLVLKLKVVTENDRPAVGAEVDALWVSTPPGRAAARLCNCQANANGIIEVEIELRKEMLLDGSYFANIKYRDITTAHSLINFPRMREYVFRVPSTELNDVHPRNIPQATRYRWWHVQTSMQLFLGAVLACLVIATGVTLGVHRTLPILVGVAAHYKHARQEQIPSRNVASGATKNCETEDDANLRHTLAIREIERKKALGIYDVFLSHNTKDKTDVEAIALKLLSVGIRPWFDKWDLLPGDAFVDKLEWAIANIRCAILFFGPADLGKWHIVEIRAYLEQWTKGEARFIPAILPNASGTPDVPLFVREVHWVDMRNFTLKDDDSFYRLVCGIIGRLPGETPCSTFTAEDVCKWTQNESLVAGA